MTMVVVVVVGWRRILRVRVLDVTGSMMRVSVIRVWVVERVDEEEEEEEA